MKPRLALLTLTGLVVSGWLCVVGCRPAVPPPGPGAAPGGARVRAGLEHEDGVAGAGPAIRYGRRVAVVVGVCGRAGEFPDLGPAPAADAGAVAEVLARRFGFEDVRLLTDRSPDGPPPPGVRREVVAAVTRTALLGLLRSLGRLDPDRDALLLYFAGHGARSGPRGAVVLAGEGGAADRLDLAGLARELRARDAHHTLAVLDCCFSGAALEPESGAEAAARSGPTPLGRSLSAGGDSLARVFARRSFQVITAGTGHETVANQAEVSAQYSLFARGRPEYRGHSPFTATLLQALQGRVGRPDGVLQASALGYFLSETLVNDEVLREVRQAPRYGALGGGEGDFLFIPQRRVLNPRLIAPLYLVGPQYADLRQAAAKALQKFIEEQPEDLRPMLTRSAVSPLAYLLQDPDSGPRLAAAEVLADLGGRAGPATPEFREVIRPLAALLRDPGQGAQLHREAARALGQLGVRGTPVDAEAAGVFEGYVRRLESAWLAYEAQLARELRAPLERVTFPADLQRQLERARSPKPPAALPAPPERLAYFEGRRQALEQLSKGGLAERLRQHEQGKTYLKQAYNLVGQQDGMGAKLTAAKGLGLVTSGWAAQGRPGEPARGALLPGTPDWEEATSVLTGPPHAYLAWCGPISWHHGSQVNALAFAPDGRTLASADHEGNVRLWGARTGEELHWLRGPGGWVMALAFSPDGSVLASAGADGVICLWDSRGGKDRGRLVGHRNSVNALAFAPDGRTLASAGDDWTVRLWDVGTGKEQRQLPDYKDAVRGVTFAPDGRTLAVSAGRTVQLWDMGAGKAVATLRPEAGLLTGAAFLPDGRSVLTYSVSGPFRVWDVGSGEETRHFGEVSDGTPRSVSLSRSGRLLASANRDGTINLWDVSTGKQLRQLRGHPVEVYSVAFSPDGKALASGGKDGAVRLWDVARGVDATEAERYEAQALGVAFSPDGRTFASGHEDGTVRVWDVATGVVLRRIEGTREAIECVAYAPDGRTLASGGLDKTVRLWDVASGKEKARFEGDVSWVYSVAFAPDGQTLASGDEAGTIRLWDVAGGKERALLEGHTRRVNALAFAPDGLTLASASYDRTARLWDAVTGKELRQLRGHTQWVSGVAFSPDGAWLASVGEDHTARLWDVRTGRKLRELKGHAERHQQRAFKPGRDRPHWAGGVVVTPDGRTLATYMGGQTIQIWDVDSGSEVARLEGHTDRVRAMAASPDGRVLLSAGEDRTLRLWEIGDGMELHRLTGHTHRVNSVAYSPDGRVIASAGDDGSVRLWDATGGAEVRRLEGVQARALSVDVAADGRTVACGYDSGVVLLSDLRTGQRLRVLRKHIRAVRCVRFAADGRTLASAGEDACVRLWDVPTGRLKAELDEKALAINCIAFAPDGRLLASAGEDLFTVRLWDVGTGKLLRELEGHTIWVRGLAFAPDGRALASASDDGTVRLWDVATGKEKARLEGHTDHVSGVAFAPDGRTLASASEDGTVRLWDVATGKERARLEGHTDRVNAVAFAPDGLALASGGHDETVRVWAAPAPLDPATYSDFYGFADYDLEWRVAPASSLQERRPGRFFQRRSCSLLGALRGDEPGPRKDYRLFCLYLQGGNVESARLLLGRLEARPDYRLCARRLASLLRAACARSAANSRWRLADLRLKQARQLTPDHPENDYLAARLLLLAEPPSPLRQGPPGGPGGAPAGAPQDVHDTALTALERAVTKGFADWRRLQTDAPFEPLRGQARFRDLVERSVPAFEWADRAGRLERSEPAKAVALAAKALDKDPRNMPALRARALAYARRRDFAGALADVEKARRLAPEEPLCWYDLARVLSLRAASQPLTAEGRAARGRDLQEALKALREAVERGWDDWGQLRREADLQPLQEQPAFKNLLKNRG